MQFDTTPDTPHDTYGTRTYTDMHGKPTTSHKADKNPWQVLCSGLDAIVAELRSTLDAIEPGAIH